MKWKLRIWLSKRMSFGRGITKLCLVFFISVRLSKTNIQRSINQIKSDLYKTFELSFHGYSKMIQTNNKKLTNKILFRLTIY